MLQYFKVISITILFTFLIGCAQLDFLLEEESTEQAEVTALADLQETDYFRPSALAHILEGEINRKGQAVGFHYDQLPTKKGSIITGTETPVDDKGIYEAEVMVDDVKKTGNRGRSTFFPDTWDSQDVVDAINEAYIGRTFIQGNTYEGLTEEGIIVQMYLDDQDKIISAFPVYE